MHRFPRVTEAGSVSKTVVTVWPAGGARGHSLTYRREGPAA
jgi:hypothetical protein